MILRNRVWERGFPYGDIGSLKNLDSEKIASCKIVVTPLSKKSYPSKKPKDLFSKYVGKHIEKDLPRGLLPNWTRNYLLIEIEYELEKQMPLFFEDNIFTIEWGGYVDYFMELCHEIGTLFRATLSLMFYTDYIIMPSMISNNKAGGVLYLEYEGTHFCDEWTTSEFTFPNSILSDSVDLFTSHLWTFANIWHYPLWSIHRYLRALDTQYVEMESFLDLLFALEGLFPNNTSVEIMRLSCIFFLAKDTKEAKKIDQILKKAFLIRNEIVHGAQTYTGMEKINIDGKEVLVQKLFWNVRQIVAGMIWVAVFKLQQTKDMKHLKITFDDIVNIKFQKKIEPIVNIKLN